MPSAVLAAARRYVAAGLSVIPVRLDGSKAPALDGWREFSERRPTAAELVDWFAEPVRHGIGIPGGPASGNLIVFDFEARRAFDRWGQSLCPMDRAGLCGSPVVFTPSNGVHVYVRTVEPVRGAKYARTAAGKCLIETRGNGHQVVAPGSPTCCHLAGRPYILARPGWIDGPVPEPMPLAAFFALTVLAADLNEYVRPAAHDIVGDRGTSTASNRPGDEFARVVSWAEILERHGWRPFSSRPGATYWTRPGKHCGVSASTGFCRGPSGADLLYVFSSSAVPFEAERSYSKFAAYALLEHGGDYRAAASTLSFVGYGAPPVRKAVRR
jgi:hypothetical protein